MLKFDFHTRAEFADGRTEFLAEGQRLAALRHPNVVRLINFFQDNSMAYLVMDLENGRILEQQIKVGRLNLVKAICNGADTLQPLH